MKKTLAILILTAMVLMAFTFSAAAADTITNYNSFNGVITSMANYAPGNITADYITASSGVYSRTAGDTSIKMSPPSTSTGANSFIKLSQSFKATNGEYVHVGLSFAAENLNFTDLGLGGKLYYNYTSAGATTSGNGFMNGTAIMAKAGKIYAFGNEISTFAVKKWYSVDIFVNSSTGYETVYLNGNLVLDNVAVTSTLQIPNDSWALTGFSDLRLNSTIGKNVTNDFYYDDLRYGIVSNIGVNSSITGNGITVSGNTIDLLRGSYPDSASIEAKLIVPTGATLNINNDNTAASVVYADGTGYVYSIINNAFLPVYSYKNNFISYTGGVPTGFSGVNTSNATENGGWAITYAAAQGAIGRETDDKSLQIDIPALCANGKNPNWQTLTNGTLNAGLDGNIIHIGGSFAINNSNFALFGIGGPVIYTLDSDETTLLGTTSNVFANNTTIAFNPTGKITAWGTEIGEFSKGMFYKIDSYINTATSCQTVYINGQKVLDNSKITASVGGTTAWKLRGYRDLRLNYQASTNVSSVTDTNTGVVTYKGSNANTIYFDDLEFENFYSEYDESSVFTPVTSNAANVTVLGGNIDFGGVKTIGEAAIMAGINIPQGAETVYENDVLRVKTASGVYFYRIVNNGITKYNFNNQTGLFTGVTYIGGLASKAADDYSVTSSSVLNVSDLNVDISDGSTLTLELNILTEEIPTGTLYLFEPWFKDDIGANVATNLIGFGPRGKIYVSGVAVANYEINRWYKVAVTFTGGSENIKVYINGNYIGEYANASGKKLMNMYRIKCTFSSVINSYFDDLVWYKGDYEYSQTAATLTSGTFTINNSYIMLADNTVTAAALKAGLTLSSGSYKIYTDSTYTSEVIDTDIITKSMVLVIDSPDGTTKQYYGFMIKNPGVRSIAFFLAGEDTINKIYELDATFEARETDVANGNKLYYKLVIADYSGNSLKGIAVKDVELNENNLFTTEYVEYITEIGAQPQLKAFVWDGTTLEPLATPVFEG